MIFSPPLARQVERGSKWQTRRPVQRDPVHGTPKPCRYKPGKTYAVQPGRGEKAVTHIRILNVRREPVGRITDDEARAEGFKTVAEFASYWMRLHDRGWPIMVDGDCPHCDEEAVVLDPASGEWVECPHCDVGTIKVEHQASDAEILDRFRRHAPTLVWVITFEQTSPARFLAAGAPVAPSGKARLLSPRKVTPRPPREQVLTEEQKHGYTMTPALALEDAAAVYGPELDEYAALGTQAWAARHKRRERDRELLAADERLRRVHEKAREHGIDIHRQEAAILQRIRALENKVLRSAA